MLIDRKFDEEQLLLETFFAKLHIERDICKKLHFGGLKPPLKKSQGGGRGLFRTSFSLIFRTQTFADSKWFFFHFAPICLDYKGNNKRHLFIYLFNIYKPLATLRAMGLAEWLAKFGEGSWPIFNNS